MVTQASMGSALESFVYRFSLKINASLLIVHNDDDLIPFGIICCGVEMVVH